MEASQVIAEQFRNKVRTNVLGLDEMLFGGIDMVPAHSVVIIKSDEPVQGTLLGLQMLYGIAQSLETFRRKKNLPYSIVYKPHFISSFMENDVDHKTFLNDMLLDTIISLSILKMTEKYVGMPRVNGSKFPDLDNVVSRLFFDVVPDKSVDNEFYSKTDALICEEAIFYNNRTNSLHKRTLTNDGDVPGNETDESRILFHRRYDIYEHYLAKDSKELVKLRQDLYDLLQFPLVDINFHCMKKNEGIWDIVKEAISPAKNKNAYEALLAVDMMGEEYHQACLRDKRYKDIRDLIDNLRDHFKLLIVMVPQSCDIPQERADMVIELKNVIDNGIDYLTRKARISYSRRQATVLGWHVYKYREYGLEFFPSLHTYFQKRRYLQRAVIYTHSSVVEDTYQQYINRNKKNLDWDVVQDGGNGKRFHFDAYLRERENERSQNVDSLFEDFSMGQSAVDVLEAILLPSMVEQRSTGDRIQDYRGSMTAIFGDGNTYKRFLTFGSIFSSALNQERVMGTGT